MESRRSEKAPIDRAIDFFGSGAALARALDVVPMTVSQWKDRGIPVERAFQIEQATNGVVTAAELRPDVIRKLS
jgi:DNA-binding transcriptional regulator YdaS (Cro superfamily)